ncbi:MAG: carboxypeptidase M32 [Lachnospiraceae bacterium]
MGKAMETLNHTLERAMALKTAMILFEWDNETLAPQAAGSYTSRVIGALSEEYFRLITSDMVKEQLQQCQKEDLDEVQKGILRELAEELERLESIPRQEYREFSQLTSEATRIWARARKEQDFDLFAPALKKLVEFQRKFASYRAKDGQPLYDVLLNDYEKGFDMKTLDRFFQELKEELVPLIQKVAPLAKQVEADFLTGDYPEDKQEKLARFLAEYVGFDFEKGILAVSAHPFTTNLHNHDVRITTHYEDKVDSSIFSVIHEAGHGIYEMGVRDDLTQTLVGEGASMGMHESQSRFFENIIGRNRAFWVPIYGKLQEWFPEQLGDIDLDRFIRSVNRPQPGLIRIEADELTYSLHIMIRYELEKQLIQGEIQVEDLPELWADKYEEYLGLRPANVAEGVLQDIHWSQGSFGYFPSYALGSAFGAQIYAHMKQEMDVDGLLEQGRVDMIREYLREHIHQYGKLKSSRQILKDMTGEDFDPKYYVEYLKEKYQRFFTI